MMPGEDNMKGHILDTRFFNENRCSPERERGVIKALIILFCEDGFFKLCLYRVRRMKTLKFDCLVKVNKWESFKTHAIDAFSDNCDSKRRMDFNRAP